MNARFTLQSSVGGEVDSLPKNKESLMHSNHIKYWTRQEEKILTHLLFPLFLILALPIKVGERFLFTAFLLATNYYLSTQWVS